MSAQSREMHQTSLCLGISTAVWRFLNGYHIMKITFLFNVWEKSLQTLTCRNDGYLKSCLHMVSMTNIMIIRKGDTYSLSDLSWFTAFSSYFQQKVRFWLPNLANHLNMS